MGGTEEMIKDWAAKEAAEKSKVEATPEATPAPAATSPSNDDGAEAVEEGA